MQNRLLKDMRYFLISQRYWWRDFLVYKEQASMWFIYSLFGILYSVLTVTVIYNVSSGIAGWSYFELLFLVSTASMAFNAVYYAVNTSWIMDRLRFGGMDVYLTKPFGRMSIFLSSVEGMGSTTSIIGAFALLVYSALKIGVNLPAFLTYLVLLAAGTLTLIIFTLMLVMLAYVLLRSGQLVQKLMNFINQASMYPLGVYGPIGQLIFTFILPVGIASSYPARAFLSNISLTGFLGVLFSAFLISMVSYILFNKLQEYYTSGGG